MKRPADRQRVHQAVEAGAHFATSLAARVDGGQAVHLAVCERADTATMLSPAFAKVPTHARGKGDDDSPGT